MNETMKTVEIMFGQDEYREFPCGTILKITPKTVVLDIIKWDHIKATFRQFQHQVIQTKKFK